MHLTNKIERDSPDRAQRRIPEEKGPFGRSSSRRTGSRSKTQTPARTQSDKDAAENWRAIDDIFSRVKEQDAPEKKTVPNDAPVGPITQKVGEPTEVILYGFPAAFQYAAIEYYERVSQGRIYEEYDRQPPNGKYNTSLSQLRSRTSMQLSAMALRKKNNYHGGNHWIKVTFDSEEAADRACYASPHVINGFLVHAELYRGTGPTEDKQIPATETAMRSLAASPQSSRTAAVQSSSLTVGGASPTKRASPAESSNTLQQHSSSTSTIPASPSDQLLRQSHAPPDLTTSHMTSLEQNSAAAAAAEKPLRIRGAKRAVLLPADQALLPTSTKWQQLLLLLPLISWFFGGGGGGAGGKQDGGMVGSQVPRKDDGSFDWEVASFYWRLWFWLDGMLGTEFCGGSGKDD